MKNKMKKKKKIFFHDNTTPPKPSRTYSEVMRSMDEMLLSLNLITRENLMKNPPSQPNDTITVTFIRRPKIEKGK
jgi:hypothetical protein